MRIISGLIRMITGLAIMGMAGYVYMMNQEALEGTKEVTVMILGQELVATPQHIIIGLITAAAIGGLIELLGILTLAYDCSARWLYRTVMMTCELIWLMSSRPDWKRMMSVAWELTEAISVAGATPLNRV